MWFDYDLSWYGFLPVYAVQDFAELLPLDAAMPVHTVATSGWTICIVS